MLKIKDNPDIELRDEAERQLKEMKEKYGKRYCPCSLVQTPETLCPCLEFRNQQEPGECHCGRYIKE